MTAQPYLDRLSEAAKILNTPTRHVACGIVIMDAAFDETVSDEEYERIRRQVAGLNRSRSSVKAISGR